jgi:glycosyl-4,4'-diaponeurosporenoate acyltransferase
MKKIIQATFMNKLALDLGIFLVSSIIVTVISTKLPERYYNYRNWIFKERKWEKNGEFYQHVFKVKRWKNHMPEIADFIKSTFSKKSIKEFDNEYIEKYLLESCRAEFAHWCIIFSSVIFLFYEGTATFVCILLIAILVDAPFIIIQRYNRPRIIRIMKLKGFEI